MVMTQVQQVLTPHKIVSLWNQPDDCIEEYLISDLFQAPLLFISSLLEQENWKVSWGMNVTEMQELLPSVAENMFQQV